jgi:ATP-dependent Zn protease
MGKLLCLVYILGVNSAQLNSTIKQNVTNLNNTIKLTNTSTSTKLTSSPTVNKLTSAPTVNKLTSAPTSTKLTPVNKKNTTINNTNILNNEIISPVQKLRTKKNIIKIFVALLVVFICLSILFICRLKSNNKKPTINISPSSINIRETFNPYERTNEKCYRRVSATNSPV